MKLPQNIKAITGGAVKRSFEKSYGENMPINNCCANRSSFNILRKQK